MLRLRRGLWGSSDHTAVSDVEVNVPVHEPIAIVATIKLFHPSNHNLWRGAPHSFTMQERL